MRLVCISDTHTRHDELILPDGDVLIHAGDWTYRGNRGEIKSFLEWFDAQPHKHKIFIAGNHELSLDAMHEKYDVTLKQMVVSAGQHGVRYLENESTVIDGVKFYGSPMSPEYKGWAFPYSANHWDCIPDDTNVLITHGPAYGIRDRVYPQPEHLGCKALKKRVVDLAYQSTALKAHIFGHIHDAAGAQTTLGMRFVNAASCGEDYRIHNQPIVVDL